MIRFRTTATAVVVYLTLSTSTTLHAQERVRAGMWESTVTLSSGQTATNSSCLKPADAAKTNGSSAIVRAETEKGLLKSGCTLKDFKADGGTMTQTMVCGSSTILIETRFRDGDSFETTSTSTDDGVKSVTRIKSRRTGAC